MCGTPASDLAAKFAGMACVTFGLWEITAEEGPDTNMNAKGSRDEGAAERNGAGGSEAGWLPPAVLGWHAGCPEGGGG